MSHLGHHQQREQEHLWRQQELAQWRQAAQAEYQRLYALPLSAHESLNRGPTILDISYRFVPDIDVDYRDGWGQEDKILREQISKLVAEGLQQLEHASLVRCQIHHEMGTFDWAATRWGRTALDRGEVPAILHGGR
jgi:hypothetical protein